MLCAILFCETLGSNLPALVESFKWKETSPQAGEPGRDATPTALLHPQGPQGAGKPGGLAAQPAAQPPRLLPEPATQPPHSALPQRPPQPQPSHEVPDEEQRDKVRIRAFVRWGHSLRLLASSCPRDPRLEDSPSPPRSTDSSQLAILPQCARPLLLSCPERLAKVPKRSSYMKKTLEVKYGILPQIHICPSHYGQNEKAAQR